MGFFNPGYVAIFALLVVATTTVTAQVNTDCIGDLISCANYLNTTGKPSDDCCTGIRKVVKSQLACLCGLYNNPSLLSGINVSQALMLPARCDIKADVSICKDLAPASSPGSSTLPPPATPGAGGSDSGTGTGSDGGGNGAATRSGISGMGIAALLFAWLLY